MILTYPVCRAVDDSGAILTAPIVTIVSVTDKAGTAIASHGATPNVAGANVSVDYDAEAHGEAWINVSISQTSSTITGLNAAPSIYAARDSGRINTGINATGQTVLAPAGLDAVMIEAGVNARQAIAVELSTLVGLLSGAGTGAIVVKAGGNPSVTRVSATTDNAGNRTAVTLTLPT